MVAVFPGGRLAGYRLVVKLQMLKAKLKQWSKEHFGSVSLVKDKS